MAWTNRFRGLTFTLWLLAALSAAACAGCAGDDADGGDAGTTGDGGGSDGEADGSQGDGATDAGDDGATDAGDDGATDAGPDADPCNGACAAGLCLADGSCVECLPSDDQCPSGSYCDTANTCVSGCKLGVSGECPDGVCNDSHACVECTATTACADPDLKCRVETETCEECLPSADDCAAGQYCTDAFVCEAGCKDDSSCASGVCNEQRECEQCVADLECGEGRVCGTFQCGPTCGNAGDPSCGGGTECCGNQCVDTERDIEHCGSCGTACAATEFCGYDGASVTCTATDVGKLCENLRGALVLTTLESDDQQLAVLKTDLENDCTPTPTLRTVSQGDTDVMNGTTGQPVAGANDLLVTLGSSFGSLLVRYMEAQDLAPVYLTGDNVNFSFRRSSDDSVIVGGPIDEETPTHAHFLLQLVRDPVSGTLILSAYGYWQEGTVAARQFISDEVLSDLGAFDEGWYVYEWTAGATAMDPDTYALVASGS